MACYHPIYALWKNRGYEKSSGYKLELEFNVPHALLLAEQQYRQGRLLKLPCRHCVGCRLAKSREWANRILMEQCYHDECWFLTLTYDDEHLVPAFPVDPATGEILSVHATLVKRDLQKFFKRLRFSTGQAIRYYCAGEYGTQSYRPHYHCLIFGLHLDDVRILRKNFNGDSYFVSPTIEKLWPFGYHILGRVTWQSAAYVARYTMKKATHGYDKRYYEYAGIEPEFQTMSLRPAIGRRYYDEHPDIFKYSTFSISTPQGGRKITPPEYFRKLYREANPDEYIERVCNSIRESAIRDHLKLALTDLNYSDILKVEEEKCLSRLASLTRDDI